jgi:hypothetical protein
MVGRGRDDSGQALAEAPFVVMVLCALVVVLLQPLALLYTKMVVGQVAADLTRVVACSEDAHAGSVLLKAYAADKLEGLPKGSAFVVPGTLQVAVSGNARTARVQVTVSVEQEPLPLFGFLGGSGVSSRRAVKVIGTATAVGALSEVSGTPADAPQAFGMVD